MKNLFKNLNSIYFYFAFWAAILLINPYDQNLNAQISGNSPTLSPNLSTPSLTTTPQNSNKIQTTANESNPDINQTKNPKKILTKREKHDAIVLFNPNNGYSIVLPGGWSVDVLEDFSNFLLSGENITTPNFTINSIIAKGNLVDARVETNIQFNITTNSEKIIKIPLGLKEGVFPAPPNNQNNQNEIPEQKLSYNYSGKSKLIITVDPKDGQYIAVISPSPNRNIQNQTNNPQKEFTSFAASTPLISPPNFTPVPPPNPSPNPSPVSPPNPTTNITSASTTSTLASTSTLPSSTAATLNGEHHEISLDLWFPITKLADGSRKLAISFPHAISSQFNLIIPSPNITALTQAPLVESSQINNGKSTQFTMLGLKPNFDITWRQKNTQTTEPRPILEIKDANILVQFDPRFIAYDATLPVQSLQNNFDKFLVQLPKNTTLDTENSEKFAENGGYSIRILSNEEQIAINKQQNKSNTENIEQDKIDQTTIVEIQSPQKTLGPLNVRLLATRRLQTAPTSTSPPSPPATASDWNEIEGFNIIGAQRQFGTLSISIPDGSRPNWRSIRGINRIDPTPQTSQDGLAAQFRFSLQPFLLRGQIITPQVRTNIKPEYQIKIEKGTLVMIMRLACTTPWSQIHSLNVQLFDWQWNGEITPTNLVNIGGIEQTSDGILNIPLVNIPEDDFIIELKLNRKFDPETLPPVNNLQAERKFLSLQFPHPQASWVEPSITAIVPGDNVDLTPIIEVADPKIPHTSGLSRVNRRTARINIELPQRQREPLIYQSDLPNPIFVTEIEFHKQKLEANIKTDIKLLEQKEQIHETISFNVSYEPVDRISLAVPQSLNNPNNPDGEIQALIGNTILRLRDESSSAAAAENAEQDKNDYAKKFIMLPEAMIGKFNLSIKYSVPPINVSEDLSEATLIPFVKPLNVTINSHKVNLIAPIGINAELREESKSCWKSVGAISPIIVTKNNSNNANSQQTNSTENPIIATENNNRTKNPESAEQQSQQSKINSRKQRIVMFESTHYGTDTKNLDNINSTNINAESERLQLLISASDRDIFGTTIVERAWIQTWLADSVRVDRAIYAIRSARETLTIQLPDRIDATKITVKKNGVTIPIELKGLQAIIPIQESENEHLNTIELWYQQPGIFRNKIQRVKFATPKFDENVLVRREYWQLILSPNKFMPFTPEGWIPEYKQTFNGLFTRPKPAFTMSDVGISEKNIDEILISDNASQFLFSSISSPQTSTFFWVDSSVVVLISSSIALLSGLILIYFPKTRYVGLVLGLVIILPTILFYNPISGLLILQTASIGIVLAIAAGYFYKLCYSEKQWILPTEKINDTEVYSVIIDESENRTHELNNPKSATIVK
ncbi:MAG: hypothetical protein LBB88_01470 [Planctomycetaceae bacterium]|jgi:hypothetical protein|nr:hypothetical protein [Planctomycetaceae bacterium]